MFPVKEPVLNQRLSFQRIWAMVLRYLYATRDPSRLTEFIFWPMIDIGFYGLIATWVSQFNQTPPLTMMFITALVLWQLIYRSNYEVCFNVIDEFWEQNIFNLAASPLTQWEWILAMMLTGLLKLSFTFIFGTFVAWLFFSINILSLGWVLIPFAGLCILSGWGTGFLAGGILIYKGPKLQQLPWVTITLAALFSTIYYPLYILPPWMQILSQSLPMTYIFEGLRELIQTHTLSNHYLIISLCLSLFYLSLSISFFIWMFKKSRQNGLPRSY